MSWLNGFNNRFKLTIPADSVDSSLTNFPVMINLSSGAGKNNFDATAVFDDLGDDHQKRFAITKNDGTTQCPMEIEYWDATEEKAVLWTKIPTVYSSVDTDIYYYWDVTTSGNTSYVGDVGDTVAQNVWDSNFKLVMHMTQDPNGDVADFIKDSTSNANHGTPAGAMTSADLVDGKIGKAIDFDGTGDNIDLGDTSSYDFSTFTIEASINSDNYDNVAYPIFLSKWDAGVNREIVLGYHDVETNFYFQVYEEVTNVTDIIFSTTVPVITTWYNVIGVYNGSNISLYVNGLSDAVSVNTTNYSNSVSSFIIAGTNAGGNYFDGKIDEVRISNIARSAAWIKATYYSNWDNFIVFQQEDLTTNWLSDWEKRIKLTIDNNKIDSTLVDFPINITLDSDTGITNTDATDVFTTISGGSKKIAITTNDGITQCYVEIERWDEGNEQANLWTKVPSVSSNEDTILYLYYDSSKSDNTTYVGDTGEAVAQNVWDSNFKLVMHMAQDPNGDVADAIKDSTSNANHGTPGGSMTSADLVDGKVGKGIDFDYSDDRIKIPYDISLFQQNMTLSFVTKSDISDYTHDAYCFSMYEHAATKRTWAVNIDTGSDTWVVKTSNDGATAGSHDTSKSVETGYHALDFVVDNANKTWDFYYDGIFVEQVTVTYSYVDRSSFLTVGGLDASGLTFDGIGDEFKLSAGHRSAAWIKATYYSNWDELVSFGSEQEMPTHYYYGYITEDDVPISRTVRLYYRDTGVLMSDTTSNIDTGYYYLTTSISGEHFIVTLDDESGKDYNALILDKLLPRGIE